MNAQSIDPRSAAAIVERLKRQERATHLALELDIPFFRVRAIAQDADIRLTRGRTKFSSNPVLAAKYFEARYGKESAAWWLQNRSVKTLTALGKRFSIRSRQQAQEWDKRLANGAAKPPIWRVRKPPTRSEFRKCVASCRSITEVKKKLHAEGNMLRRWSRLYGVPLPNAKLHPHEVCERSDLTRHALERLVRGAESIAEVVRRARVTRSARVHPTTVKNHARVFGVQLPLWNDTLAKRRRERCVEIARLLEQGYSQRQIMKKVHCANDSIARWSRQYRFLNSAVSGRRPKKRAA